MQIDPLGLLVNMSFEISVSLKGINSCAQPSMIVLFLGESCFVLSYNDFLSLCTFTILKGMTPPPHVIKTVPSWYDADMLFPGISWIKSNKKYIVGRINVLIFLLTVVSNCIFGLGAYEVAQDRGNSCTISTCTLLLYFEYLRISMMICKLFCIQNSNLEDVQFLVKTVDFFFFFPPEVLKLLTESWF